MKITVKTWMAEQKRLEMAKYNLAPCFEYATLEDGSKYWIDLKADTVTMKVAEVLKESEKAVQVALECETRVGMNAHSPFKMWFPKSQIVELA